MKAITQTYRIHAPRAAVWQALVNPKDIKAWSGAAARMGDTAGAPFSLWSGDIHGTNTDVIPEKKLVQDWYGGDWPKPSRATFVLTEKNGVTTVRLTHTGVPADEVQNFADGWKDYYMGPLTEYMERLA